MKKNKGFSLVELIIVIAIMAILAAAIAPALIRYIDKSRKADDVTAAGTVATAVSAALANEKAYEDVSAYMTNGQLVASATAGQAFSSPVAKFQTELNANLTGNVAPKIKYKKTVKSVNPGGWAIKLSHDVPIVYVTSAGGQEQTIVLSPSIDEEYQ